ncbi:CpsD/CapB family tyrosine-protein kinase [Paenibacillus aurantius]|uniref:non-specific protein-tyrosine kinase n=1 Tax=Paenibacillus aurantius TaxID=2918900 RepID=A0AA96LD25_9BACL|nr:CpsD/CapB family tyrosine-protein kinase [Paenibacillus aurantius]WNQ10833.1 CpsD/CapB family tyrosine-protein kinase [Paenibacillus aurantius]
MRLPTINRPIIMDVNPHSPIAEAYRTLRTNIEFSAVDEEIRVIMINSAQPGEGKSTTAANLAAAYALSGKKVLLIDADLRKPTVHHIFGLSNRFGVTNLLTTPADFKEAVRETHVDNLHVLTSGPTPPNPSELLGSKKMENLVHALKEAFDVLIIDTPPTLAVTDAQIVAALCDGVLLVLESGRIKREIARKAKANLEHVNARILGIVLNNVKRRDGDAPYYYYGSSAKGS